MSLRPIKDMLVGALVGIVSMLPGASGATIAVIFGIYERLISDLADIRHKLFRDLRFLIPLGIGIVLGLFVCAFGLEALMDRWEIPTMFFFAALILTQIPDIKSLASDDNAMTAWNWIALVAGFAVMIVFIFVGDGRSDRSTSGALVWVLVGIILAISKLAPGVSGSTVLLALGLFGPFMDALTDFDMSVLVPGGIGLLVGVLAFSRIIDHFITNSRKSTYMAILGLTIGSIVTVSVDAAGQLDGTMMIVQSIIGIILGLVLGTGLGKISKVYAKETIEEKVQA